MGLVSNPTESSSFVGRLLSSLPNAYVPSERSVRNMDHWNANTKAAPPFPGTNSARLEGSSIRVQRPQFSPTHVY